MQSSKISFKDITFIYIATDVDHTYHLISCEQSGKSTIELTIARGTENINIQAFDLKIIKTRHSAIEISK